MSVLVSDDADPAIARLGRAKMKSVEGRDRQDPQVVIRAILDGVVAGTFVPGQRLIESELAAELKVAPARVGEAVRILLRDGVLEQRMQRGTHIRRLDRADIVEITAATQHTLIASMVYLARKVASGEVAKTKVRGSLAPKRDRIVHSARNQLAHSLLGALRDYHERALELLGNDFMAYMIERVRAEHFHAEYLRAIREGTDLKIVGETYRALTRAVIAGDADLTSEQITRQAAWNLNAISPFEELPGYLTGRRRSKHLRNNKTP